MYDQDKSTKGNIIQMHSKTGQVQVELATLRAQRDKSTLKCECHPPMNEFMTVTILAESRSSVKISTVQLSTS